MNCCRSKVRHHFQFFISTFRLVPTISASFVFAGFSYPGSMLFFLPKNEGSGDENNLIGSAQAQEIFWPSMLPTWIRFDDRRSQGLDLANPLPRIPVTLTKGRWTRVTKALGTRLRHSNPFKAFLRTHACYLLQRAHCACLYAPGIIGNTIENWKKEKKIK